MSYPVVTGGSLAAAVLGSAATTAHAASAGHGSGTTASVRLAGTQFVHELARTGTSLTTLLMICGVVLMLAGLMLVGLTRRHALTGGGAGAVAPPDLR